MSEYIKREDARNAINKYLEDNSEYSCTEREWYEQGLMEADLAIIKLPPADVVEVVRCKDCKYWRPDARPEDSLEDRTDGLWGWGNLCVKHLPLDECEAIEFGPEEFCNFGERRSE